MSNYKSVTDVKVMVKRLFGMPGYTEEDMVAAYEQGWTDCQLDSHNKFGWLLDRLPELSEIKEEWVAWDESR